MAVSEAASGQPVRLVTGKGMEERAAQVRGLAGQANVPIMGNPHVGRAL
ncbi:hypothetical protein [Paraburkholderia ginsengiterrae]|nr:hypothetical protein [Paraburkholderia ginsengiterrae]